jgi:hypothetical protein
MRPTSNSEKFLLGILGLIVLGGAVYFGGDALEKKQRDLDNQRAELKADNAEAQVDLLQAPVSAQRQKWIHDHEPAFGEEDDTRAQVLNFIVKGARDHHLEIQEQNMGQVQHGPGGARVEAEIKIKGGMESLSRWLADLQKPESFYAVDFLSLKADPDQKSVICSLRVARYFREGGS